MIIWASSWQACYKFVTAVQYQKQKHVQLERRHTQDRQIREKGFLWTRTVHYQRSWLVTGIGLAYYTTGSVITGVYLQIPSHNCQRKWNYYLEKWQHTVHYLSTYVVTVRKSTNKNEEGVWKIEGCVGLYNTAYDSVERRHQKNMSIH